MVMANGQTESSSRKVEFRPRKFSHDDIPLAPEAKWMGRIVKGTCKATMTGDGDPKLSMPFKLEKADDPAHEKFQGMEIPFSVTLVDDANVKRTRAANFARGRLRTLCEAMDLEFAEVFPGEIKSLKDFDPFFRAVEGKLIELWTAENTFRASSGEQVTNIEVRFSAPGAGLATKGDDEEEEEETEEESERPGRKPKKKAK